MRPCLKCRRKHIFIHECFQVLPSLLTLGLASLFSLRDWACCFQVWFGGFFCVLFFFFAAQGFCVGLRNARKSWGGGQGRGRGQRGIVKEESGSSKLFFSPTFASNDFLPPFHDFLKTYLNFRLNRKFARLDRAATSPPRSFTQCRHLVTIVEWSEPTTNGGARLLTRGQALLGVHRSFHCCPFSAPGSSPGPHITFSCRFSSVCSSLWQPLTLSLFSWRWYFWRVIL